MGPRLRGDDSGESLPHIFEGGDPLGRTAELPARRYHPGFTQTVTPITPAIPAADQCVR